MIAIDVQIEGDAELKAKLERMARRMLNRDVMTDVGEAGGEIVAAAARAREPGSDAQYEVDKIKTGRVEVKIGVPKEKWYWRFIETGATAHEIKPRAKGGKKALLINEQFAAHAHPAGFPARPFLRPAITEKQDEATHAMSAEYKKVMHWFTKD